MSIEHHGVRRRVDGQLKKSMPVPSTPGQRWRFRRNLVIYVAHRSGLSQRFLADVFDLPRSRIGEIIREYRQFESGS